MILGRMGKRKLRFDVRKNYERQKKAAKRACTVSDTGIVPTTDLMIKIPQSIYAEAVASHYTVECSISVFCRHNGRVHWSLELI